MSTPLHASVPGTPRTVSSSYQSRGALFVLLALFTGFVILTIIAVSFGGPQGATYGVALVIVEMIVLLSLMTHMIRTIQPYEIGLVSIFGSYRGSLKPGFSLVSPVASVWRVDLRTKPQEFSMEEAKTKDLARIQVKGLYYYRVVDAVAATFKVQDPRIATIALTMSELRRVVHEMNLTDILSDEAEALASRLEQVVNEGTSKWGVKVGGFEIKDVIRLPSKKLGRGEEASESPGIPLQSGKEFDPEECPYCRAPLEKGVVGAESLTGGANWYKSRSTLALGGEPIGDSATGGMVWLDGYRCRNCRKLILQS